MELRERTTFEERTIEVRRVSRVMEGGKRLSFRALVVVGDGKGQVGAAIGKALGVPEAVRKAVERAKRQLVTVPMLGDTVPHEVWGRMKATRVLIKPAAPGTGVIASGPVRAVLELAGIKNALTKVFGSRNPINVVQATIDALQRLRTPEEVAQMRGKSLRDLPIPRKLRRWLEQDVGGKATSQSDLGA
jgi:small subunit ribosomal protein S5